MKIAIVDDFADERALLRRRLKRQFAQRGVQADFFEYENGTSFLSAAAKEQFTVLFLDIYMDGKNGIDVAKEFRKTDTTCLLIFTTTSTDHALEGFQVRAMHYLVKPYTERDIAALLDENSVPYSKAGKLYHSKDQRKRCTHSSRGNRICGTFLPHDPYSYVCRKNTDYQAVFRFLYRTIKKRSAFFSLQPRSNHQSGSRS